MSDTGFVSLRGYALKWLDIGYVNGIPEYFDFGSIDPATNCPVYLNFREHSAPSICNPVDIFTDSYGLGFLASISELNWLKIKRDVLRGGAQFASGMFHFDEEGEVELANGERCRRFVKAKIQHITIMDHSAVYKGTGVWPAEVVGEMPPRLAELNGRWEVGRAYWLARQSAALALRNAKPSRIARQPATPDSVLASRRQELLQAIGSILACVKPGMPTIIGHAAFSRKGLAALEKAVGVSLAAKR
jgi:hypothetical protein